MIGPYIIVQCNTMSAMKCFLDYLENYPHFETLYLFTKHL